MCVIIYKPKNIEFPELDILKKCYDANSHGCGLAWNDYKKVHVIKGIMKYESLEKLHNFFKKLTKYDVVMHFRLASAGSITAMMTHPFTISEAPLNKGYQETKKTVLFHNGTVLGLGGKHESDTYMLAKWLNSLKSKGLKNTDLVSILERLSGNKFVMLSPRKVYLTGYGWHEHQGCKFSNMSWNAPIIFNRYNLDGHQIDWRAYYDY